MDEPSRIHRATRVVNERISAMGDLAAGVSGIGMDVGPLYAGRPISTSEGIAYVEAVLAKMLASAAAGIDLRSLVIGSLHRALCDGMQAQSESQDDAAAS